jgi:hypothetical protein
MVDPAIAATVWTASKIADLAFQKFVESSAGKLAEKFTLEAIAKMDILIKQIWNKLSGKARIDEVKASIEQIHTITPEQTSQIAAYLQVAMDEDPQFANDIRLLAQDINIGKLVDQSRMVQNVSDQAKGWQTKVEGGTAFIGEIHQYGTIPKSKE